MWQPVLMINGFIVFVLGAMMGIPVLIDLYYTNEPDFLFIQSAIIAMFLGGALFLANFGKITKVSIIQGYLITVVCWLVLPFVCALPLMNNGDITSFSDALFEATSGITATGATILKDIESQPKSVLFWRSLLNGLGGIGIVIFAVALMPFLGIGGMNIFNKENSDTEEKFLPKLRDIAKDIIITYLILNLCCAFLLNWAGMNWFDASTFTMSTLGTGGLTPKNNSIAFFDSPKIESIVAIFMIAGALPITYFILILKKRSLNYITSNTQVNAFIKILIIYISFFSIYLAYSTNISLLKAFRLVGFNFISAITTTGIISSDFTNWGNWCFVVFLLLYFHGGCTGSTTGSIKIFRWQVIKAFFKKNTIKALSPNQVVVMKAGDKIIDDKIVSSVFILVLGFVFATILFTLVLCLLGIDFTTALGAVSACITNSGVGLTANIGPSGNFSQFNDYVKYILSFAMVLGRLEVISFVTILSKLKIK